jgi:hypothetical protein
MSSIPFSSRAVTEIHPGTLVDFEAICMHTIYTSSPPSTASCRSVARKDSVPNPGSK